MVTGLWVVSYLGFPEIHELYTAKDPAKLLEVLENSPEKLWPIGFCVALGAWGAVSSLLVGFQIAWFAPAAKMGHGIFLSLLCLISFLQVALKPAGVPVAFLLCLMVCYPLLIYAGANVGTRWAPSPNPDDDMTNPMESTDEA